jgi:hypothetical protein
LDFRTDNTLFDVEAVLLWCRMGKELAWDCSLGLDKGEWAKPYPRIYGDGEQGNLHGVYICLKNHNRRERLWICLVNDKHILIFAR